MIDKKTYWKNRKEGKRSQGEAPNLVVNYTPSYEVAQGTPNSRREARAKKAK